MTGTDIITEWILDSKYTCKNRTIKTTISLKTYICSVGYKRERVHIVTCETHGIDCEAENKYRSEALCAQRKPWLWCDECAKIHEVVWLGEVRSDDL